MPAFAVRHFAVHLLGYASKDILNPIVEAVEHGGERRNFDKRRLPVLCAGNKLGELLDFAAKEASSSSIRLINSSHTYEVSGSLQIFSKWARVVEVDKVD